MSLMQPLLPREVLALWDEGAARHPLDRSALLCARARSDLPSEAIVDLPLGEVTRSVLRLREASFGERIDSHMDCPACGARLAVSVLTSELLPAEPAVHSLTQPPVQSPVQLAADAALKAGLRPPSLRDLAAVAQVADAQEGARLLLARCLRDDAAAAAFAGADLAQIEAAFEALDPYADLDLSVTCTECGKPASVTLDAGVVLWDEIDAHARALLRTVHAIAAVYGWTEAEILNMGPARRAAYLAMVSS